MERSQDDNDMEGTQREGKNKEWEKKHERNRTTWWTIINERDNGKDKTWKKNNDKIDRKRFMRNIKGEENARQNIWKCGRERYGMSE